MCEHVFLKFSVAIIRPQVLLRLGCRQYAVSKSVGNSCFIITLVEHYWFRVIYIGYGIVCTVIWFDFANRETF